jgi:ABC-type phosphate transport system substrate-binding protein
MKPKLACLVAVFVAVVNVPNLHGQPDSASHDSTVLRIWGEGSSELLRALNRLEAGYSAINPDTHFLNQLHGNDSALGGLYVGAADLVFMTREPSYIELDGYQQMIPGQTPLQVAVMRGGPTAHGPTSPLVLVVNRANPLASVELTKLKAVFTDSHGSGLPVAGFWRDLGVKGSQAQRPIHLYGFDIESDEAVIFALAALGIHPRWTCKYNAAPDTPNAASQIFQEVQNDPDGLGLTTLDAVGPNAKVLEIAASGGAVGPTSEALGSGEYILGRTVFALARRTSEANAESPAVRDFLSFVLSTQGQAILRSDGTFISVGGSAMKATKEALK